MTKHPMATSLADKIAEKRASLATNPNTQKLRAALEAAVALAEKQAEARRTMTELHLALARQIALAEADGPLSVMGYAEAVNKVLAAAGSAERLPLQR